MDALDQVLKYLDEHSKGLGFLYTLLGGVIAALLFVAKPLVKYLFASKAADDSKEVGVPINTFDINAVKELLAAARSESALPDAAASHPHAEDPPRILAPDDVLNAAKTLSDFRNLLKPAHALNPDVFPSGMQVLKFEPERLLVITLRSTVGEKGCFGAFSILHWTIFPSLGIGWLGGLFVGSSVSWVFNLIGLAVGIYCWAWLVRNGPYIRINLQKNRFAVVSVASWTSNAGRPTAEIQLAYKDNRWIATLTIGGYDVAVRTSSDRKQAIKELEPFVNALNWRLGNRIVVAEGVFVEPPKATSSGEA